VSLKEKFLYYVSLNILKESQY